MLISKAWAQDVATTAVDAAMDPAMAAQPEGPSFMMSFGLLMLIVVAYYVLLVMPQQKRFKEHKLMLDGLDKGDDVITGGGLIGKIEKVLDDNELLIDLGNGLKVTAVRSTVTGKMAAMPKDKKSSNKSEPKEKKTKSAKSSEKK